VNTLDFLSPSRCAEGTIASPLQRALADADGIEDLSFVGKVEIRGDLDRVRRQEGVEELVRLTPRRGYLLTKNDPAEVVERLRADGVLAYDATGALAGFAVQGEQLMRRLTDLDLDHEKLPAAGPFARATALIFRDEAERFRVYVPQELGHDVAVHVLDALAGLEQNA
jgi:hypothetical protein